MVERERAIHTHAKIEAPKKDRAYINLVAVDLSRMS